MTSTVLVVNAGSSSVKYQLVDPASGESHAKGLIERIGLADGALHHTVAGQRHDRSVDVPDHAAAMSLLEQAFAEHGPDLREADLVAVGHRVVHGGADFADPTLITPEVLEAIEALVPLAPLHNPGNLQGVRAAQRAFPDVPQVAVFDTAFHQDMPLAAATYAVPRSWREEHQVRRYGFHGTSHAYVSRRVADLMSALCEDGSVREDLKVVVLHLGNGASATAVRGGRSVDTSMGMTPLEGLVMGTRPGDVDPGLPGHLAQVAGLSPEDYARALSKESGLLGLTGSADMREVVERREAGDEEAKLAFDVMVHRLLRYVGGFAAVMGGLDAVVFTAGIGENTADLRAAVLEPLAFLGVEIDLGANASARRGEETRISAPSSRVQAWVVPTDEEFEIAHQAATVAAGG